LRTHRSALVPRRFVLCGGGATIAQIDAELARRLDESVGIWRMPRGDAASAAAPQPFEPLLASAAALSSLAWSA
jgi:hypothetical protein